MKREKSDMSIHEDAFRQLFELSNDLLSISNFDGCFTKINKKWVEVLGYSEKELTSRSYMEFVHPDDYDRTLEEAKALFSGKPEVIKFQNRYLKKNGGIVWLEWNVVVDQKKKCIYSVTRDISDKKEREILNEKVQQAIIDLSGLSTLEEMSFEQFQSHFLKCLKSLFEVDYATYWSFDQSLTTLTCEKVIGQKAKSAEDEVLTAKEAPNYFKVILKDKVIAAEDAKNHPATKVFAHPYLEKHGVKSLLDAKFRNRANHSGVVCLECKQTRHWTKDEQGHLVSLIQILANAVLCNEKKSIDEKIQAVSEIASDFAFEVEVFEDNSRKLNWYYGGFNQITGYPQDQFEKLFYSRKIFHSDDLKIVEDRVSTLLEGKEAVTQFRIRHANGNYIWVESTGSPKLNEKNGRIERIISSVRDITEEKKYVDQLEAAKDELSKAYDLLRGATDIARIGSWEVDLITSEVYWSPTTCEIHEVPMDYKVDVNNAIKFYKEGYSRDRITELVNKSIKEGIPYDEELILITSKGRELWVRGIGMPIIENGETVRMYGLFQDIDEQKRAKLEIEKLSLAVSQINECVIITDAERKTQWVNESFTRITGYTLDEVKGKDVGKILQGEETDPEHKRLIKEGLKSKKSFRQEIINYSKDGKAYWIELAITPVFNKEGELTQFVGIQSEITERKKAELKITDQKMRLSQLIESTNIGTWEWNVQTGETVFNERWAEMIGYSLQEISPVSFDTWEQFVMKEDFSKAEEALKKHFSGESEFYDVEFRMHHKNGGFVWIWARGKVVSWTEEGEPLMMFGTQTDITSQKLAEKTLEEKEHFIQRIFDSSLNGIYIYSIEYGTNLYMNKRYTELTGYNIDEINRMSDQEFFALFHSDDQDQIAKHMRELSQAKMDTRIDPIEYRFLKANGEWMWCLSADVPFDVDKNGNVTQFLGTFIDITELKKAETEILRMQKLDELGTVAGGIAHDFNNYLTAIFSNLEILRMSLPENSKSLGYIWEMSNALKTARQLTGQLLTFAKGGDPALSNVDTNALIKETVLFNLHGSKVKAKFDVSNNVWSVFADEGQIGQVLANLTINAVQAMPEGGTLFVSAENVFKKDPTKSKKEQPMVCIKIRDQGVGIPTKIVNQVFDPYFTTKETGHGLGLSVVHSIVTRHDGLIEVDSVVDVGTTFSVYLPRSFDTVDNNSENMQEKKDKSKALNVLFMDDNEMILKAGANMLSLLGHEVDTVKSGDEALEKYKEGIRYDLAIMDLTIPGGRGGKEVIFEILQIEPEAKVIASSGYASNPVMANYEEYGFIGKLAKPYTFDEIMQEIDRVFNL